MSDINPLDETEIRREMRRVYKEIGKAGALQVVYELMLAAEVMLDIVYEETLEEYKKHGNS